MLKTFLMAGGSIALLVVIGQAMCGKDEFDRARERSEPSAASAPQPPQPQVVTRKLSDVLEQDKGQKVCVCGYVQSTTRPRGDVNIGTIYLSTKRRLPRDNESFPTVICWWGEDDPAPTLKQWQPACAVGKWEPPTLQDCRVVDKCP